MHETQTRVDQGRGSMKLSFDVSFLRTAAILAAEMVSVIGECRWIVLQDEKGVQG